MVIGHEITHGFDDKGKGEEKTRVKSGGFPVPIFRSHCIVERKTAAVMLTRRAAGRQFDKDGNMMQWWNNATVRAFRDRAQCIVDQYSRYKLQDITSFINGRMTQGENIADNGGLKQAFRVSRDKELFIFIEHIYGRWSGHSLHCACTALFSVPGVPEVGG